MTEVGGLIKVQILGLPIAEQIAASQHFDELLREFGYLHGEDATGTGVPSRLMRLRDELSGRFDTFTAGVTAEMDAAITSGAETVDLVYELPGAAAGAAQHLGELLDEADEFCRSGEHLLTLATPPGPLRFRRWFLAEFCRQAAGEPPTPWAAYSG
jgi:hypothetical protein